MPNAKTFRREDLPAALQSLHRAIADHSWRVFQKLVEHAAPVLARIHSSIGGTFELARADVKQQVIHSALTVPITVVTGPSGSGKSAVAKAAVEQLSHDRVTASFHAEEFAEAHLDTVLLQAHIPCNASDLKSILAGQTDNILLIESVERLLEASQRQLFCTSYRRYRLTGVGT